MVESIVNKVTEEEKEKTLYQKNLELLHGSKFRKGKGGRREEGGKREGRGGRPEEIHTF
jgi:hypothetical protein